MTFEPDDGGLQVFVRLLPALFYLPDPMAFVKFHIELILRYLEIFEKFFFEFFSTSFSVSFSERGIPSNIMDDLLLYCWRSSNCSVRTEFTCCEIRRWLSNLVTVCSSSSTLRARLSSVIGSDLHSWFVVLLTLFAVLLTLLFVVMLTLLFAGLLTWQKWSEFVGFEVKVVDVDGGVVGMSEFSLAFPCSCWSFCCFNLVIIDNWG